MDAHLWRRHAELNPIDLWPAGGVPGYRAEYAQDSSFLTPFLVEGAPGAVIVLPGGGYRIKARHEAIDVALRLNELGFSALVLDYRVQPYGFPVPQLDALRAVRYVRYHAAQWRIAPDKIAVLGFSAGGHLAACAGVAWDDGDAAAADAAERVSSRPDALVLCYAVTNLTKFYPQAARRDAHFAGDDALYAKICNPVAHVNAYTPPTFLWHTADDAVVPVESSLDMHAALRACGVPAQLHIYAHGQHGLGLAPGSEAAGWSALAGDFLRGLGF
ncbi:MAG: alpha/beta hydrolase [Eubacteriales bacterium]|nr:alpha/beta hydrolase [Eubacteriales bacterium]